MVETRIMWVIIGVISSKQPQQPHCAITILFLLRSILLFEFDLFYDCNQSAGSIITQAHLLSCKSKTKLVNKKIEVLVIKIWNYHRWFADDPENN